MFFGDVPLGQRRRRLRHAALCACRFPPRWRAAAASSPDAVTVRLRTAIWNPRDALGGNRRPRPRCYGGPRGDSPRALTAARPAMFDHLEIYTPRERWAVRPGRCRPRRRSAGRFRRRDGRRRTAARPAAPARAHRRSADVARRDPRRARGMARRRDRSGRRQLERAARPPDPRGHARRDRRRRVAGARSRRAHRRRRWSRRATGWRARRYDLAINFEPDIRCKLAGVAGARRRVGFRARPAAARFSPTRRRTMARRHVADNGRALVERAFDLPPGSLPRRHDRGGARSGICRCPTPHGPRRRPRWRSWPVTRAGPLVGVHAPGGRESSSGISIGSPRRLGARQRAWARRSCSPAGPAIERRRRARCASRLAATRHRPLRAAGRAGSVMLAALLAAVRRAAHGRHRADAPGGRGGHASRGALRPVDPWRYGPLAAQQRVVRVDLPCSPCGQVRLPPERCRGHVPDCMDGITGRRGGRRAAICWLDAERGAGMDAVTMLEIETRAGPHSASTSTPLLDAGCAEQPRDGEANQWIKRLRLARYGGRTMRDRFTYRGDSLWWFTELYLHKMRSSTRRAGDRWRSSGRASDDTAPRWFVDGTDDVVSACRPRVGGAHAVACDGRRRAAATSRAGSSRVALFRRPSATLFACARRCRRPRPRPRSSPPSCTPRSGARDERAKSVHRPRPRRVAPRLPGGALGSSGVGPRTQLSRAKLVGSGARVR